MPTVLLRLSAPLQAYGTASRWEERATTVRPTKSAVVGLVANALGYELDDDLTDLGRLVFAVRADRPGHLMTDQQTAGGGNFPATPLTPAEPGAAVSGKWYGAARSPVPDAEGTLRASWRPADRTPVLINKQYVADGAFLAGLSTPLSGPCRPDHRSAGTPLPAPVPRPALVPAGPPDPPRHHPPRPGILARPRSPAPRSHHAPAPGLG